jgi:hypothetical protein
MTNDAKSDISAKEPRPGEPSGKWLKLSAVAFASALLGGIATAWWYRKTVQKLHETGENENNPQFGITSGPDSKVSGDDF